MTARNSHSLEPRIGARDAGLRRLHRATALGLAAAGALSVVFGDLAAHAFHGRTGATKAGVAVHTSTTAHAAATPPPLVSAGSAAQAAAAQAPAQSQAPPVAVSGGT